MSLEIGILHNGSQDLDPLDIDGVLVSSGTLAEVDESLQRVLKQMVRQGVLAEQLGYDYFWQTEHHFEPEGAEFSPSPLLTGAAIAAQTSRIRLGQAANILTWNHPIRLAEEAAMLDVLSDGRVEFGIARGYQSRETEVLGRAYGATNQDEERSRVAFEEAYEILMKAWTEPSFTHRGENFSLPPSYTKWSHPATRAYFGRDDVGVGIEEALEVQGERALLRGLQVFPKPVQKPHPQIWQPVTSSRSVQFAARNGVNAICNMEANERLRETVHLYYEEAERAGWPDRLGRGEFKYGWDADRGRGVVTTRWVHVVDGDADTAERARQGIDLILNYILPLRAMEAVGTGRSVPTVQTLTESEVIIIGSAEEVAEKLLRVREVVGYNDFMINVVLELPGLRGEEIETQMELFAAEVTPRLRAACGSEDRQADALEA